MKLVLVIDDESWFWVYDEDDQIWYSYYEENAESPAVRTRHLDRPTGNAVTFLMWHMAEQAMLEKDKVQTR